MHTARLQTVCASVATRCQYQWGWCPQVNKVEQVSSDGHKMSLGGGGLGLRGTMLEGAGWRGLMRSNAS